MNARLDVPLVDVGRREFCARLMTGQTTSLIDFHKLTRCSPFVAAWAPPAGQEAYFNALFSLAENGAGLVTGAAAVAFFSKSGLERPLLKAIWDAANLRGGKELSRNEFFIALRLISVAQAGAPPSREALITTAAQPLLPPRFTGPYAIQPSDFTKFEGVFRTVDTDGDGLITGKEAVELFIKSGLDRSVLKQIWSLSDMDRDGCLDFDEFAIAMALVVGASKRGQPVPPSLPLEMVPPRKVNFFQAPPPPAAAVAAPAPAPAAVAPVPSAPPAAAPVPVVVAEPSPAVAAPVSVDSDFGSQHHNHAASFSSQSSIAPSVATTGGVTPSSAGALAMAHTHARSGSFTGGFGSAAGSARPAATSTASIDDAFGGMGGLVMSAPAPIMPDVTASTVPAPVHEHAPVSIAPAATVAVPSLGSGLMGLGGGLANSSSSSSGAVSASPRMAFPPVAAPAPAAQPASPAVAPAVVSSSSSAAAESDLTAAFSSHVSREQAALQSRQAVTAAARGEVESLEKARAEFAAQLTSLRESIDAEDAEFRSLTSTIASLRSELTSLRGSVDATSKDLAASPGRTAEARGVVAALASQLAAVTSRGDAVADEVKGVLMRCGTAEATAARIAAACAEVAGLTAQHSAAASSNNEETAALRSATAAAEERIARLTSEKEALMSRLGASTAAVTSALDRLAAAEAELERAREAHEKRWAFDEDVTCLLRYHDVMFQPTFSSLQLHSSSYPFDSPSSACSTLSRLSAKSTFSTASRRIGLLEEAVASLQALEAAASSYAPLTSSAAAAATATSTTTLTSSPVASSQPVTVHAAPPGPAPLVAAKQGGLASFAAPPSPQPGLGDVDELEGGDAFAGLREGGASVASPPAAEPLLSPPVSSISPSAAAEEEADREESSPAAAAASMNDAFGSLDGGDMAASGAPEQPQSNAAAASLDDAFGSDDFSFGGPSAAAAPADGGLDVSFGNAFDSGFGDSATANAAAVPAGAADAFGDFDNMDFGAPASDSAASSTTSTGQSAAATDDWGF